MHAVPLDSPTGARSPRRLTVLLVCGVLAIAGGLLVRNSRWARERELSVLGPDQLALAIHDHPNDPLVFQYYGSALVKSGDLANSERAFRRAVSLDPKLPAAQIGLGTLLLQSGKPNDALPCFEAASRLNPRDTTALLGLAQAYHRMGSSYRALAPLEKITALEPKKAVAWYTLGKEYGDAHMSDRAVAAMERAVKLDPRRAEFWSDLGQLYLHYSRLDQAEQALKKARGLAPGDAATEYWLGSVYLQKGPGKEAQRLAEEHLQAALERDRSVPEFRLALGELYERRRDWSRAVDQFRTVQRLDPSSSRCLYHLGLCLTNLGKVEEGRRYMKAFQELVAAKQEIEGLENRWRSDPRNGTVVLRLARAYRKYGNDESALIFYRRYLDLQPKDRAVREEAKRLVAQLKPAAAGPAEAHTP